MPVDSEQPSLNFFRTAPPGLADRPPLASSLQSFETSLLLIGLRRYPAALIACGSAWESCAKAKLGIGPDDKIEHWKLQERLRREYPGLREVSDTAEHGFRKKRNAMTHFGFSPHDDEECAALLLGTGLPYLKLMYRELFDFYLDWWDILPKRDHLHDLPKELGAKVGLLPEFAKHLRGSLNAFCAVKSNGDVEKCHCFAALSHFVLGSLQYAASSPSEWVALTDPENTWEASAKLAEKLKDEYGVWASFDCPVCGGGDALIAALDEQRISEAVLLIERLECVECGFRIDPSGAYMANFLLREQIAMRTPEVLKDYGISSKSS